MDPATAKMAELLDQDAACYAEEALVKKDYKNRQKLNAEMMKRAKLARELAAILRGER